MKKFLPLILFFLGALVLGIVFFFITRSTKEGGSPEEEKAPEVTLADRPIASLTPSTDGHTLNLKIEKIKITAKSLDYELLYSLPDGRTQGVPGSITLKGESSIVRELLLGSESSGKKRYDEGVKEGTLTLKFRSDTGKLLAKFVTKWFINSTVTLLPFGSAGTSKFYELTKIPSKTFFITMETFGVPSDPPESLVDGPYGVFSSAAAAAPGKLSLGHGTPWRWSGSQWTQLTDGKSSDIGIFILTSK